jgi:hypothetical protein
MHRTKLGVNAPGSPELPQWWSEGIDAAWSRTREAAIDDWNVRGDRSPIDASIVEDALAFGHGARSAYPHCSTWDSVSTQLHADWVHLGNTGPAAWDCVSRIIHHEWLRAGGPGGDAPPEP